MEQFSLISLNLWNTEYWQERETCIISFLKTFDADVYCFQEIRHRLSLYWMHQCPVTTEWKAGGRQAGGMRVAST